MNKTIQYLVDIILVVLISIIGVTGVFIFPGFLHLFGFNLNDLPKIYIFEFHHWIGVALIAPVVLHVFFHRKLLWKQLQQVSKKTTRTPIPAKILIRHGSNLLLLLLFSIMFTTGIMKFPGFSAVLHLDPRALPISTISLVHDWTGIATLLLSILHLGAFLKK